MLCEVAQLNAFRQPDFAVERSQFACQQLNQRRFARAVAAQQADARARHQIELDSVENNALAVACGDFLHLQQRVGQTFRRAEAEAEGVVDVRRRDHLHALQHLNAALRLLRF